MKAKITLREGKRISHYSVHYGCIQNLTNCHNPIAYSAGNGGWYCDYYNIGGYILATGHKTPAAKTISYDITQKYEAKADLVLRNVNDYQEAKTMLEKLVRQMIEENKTA